ncbi:MAG TPA: crotonase [Chromatiales bacterium]|nr:crotonase [Thiotrichales bacterium]HIP68986.1 crotonase [Chromatiales bacterium]
MTKQKHWHLKEEKDGILWLAIDVAGQGANTLSKAVLEELSQVLDQISENPPQALVLHSTKASGFIAGADVNEFTQFTDEQSALEMIERGQRVMDRIAGLPFPVIAVINGFCLGGGLELALACDYRIVVNSPSTRLGLPEVKLGIHPGFGGSVRSVNTIGILKAMDLMLSGRTIGAYQAKKMGLAHEMVPERQIENVVSWYASHRPSKVPQPLKEKLLRSKLLRPLIAKLLRKQVAKKANPHHYPAPYALINLWEHEVTDEQAMLKAEAESVAKLATTKTARNLVRVFQLQDQLKALGKKSTFTPRHVHVIGAGTMGGDIAAWCALQGFNVTVEDSNPKALGATLKRATKLYQRRFRGYDHLATAALDRLVPDIKGQGRKYADVIIEAIFEDEKVKQDLFSALEKEAKTDAVLATNTSSIPLEKIASVLKSPERLVGLHFFNPVAKMPLVEVVYAEATDPQIREHAQAFTRHISKLPLPVKSSPGFLVNRILMPYLLEASRMVDEGIPKEAIDKAATDFGMPMGPLELADTVGLDICKHVAEVLSEPMQLTVPASIKNLVEAGHLGKKTGRGYYIYKKNKPQKGKIDKSQGKILQKRLIDKLTDEAQNCLEDGIVATSDQLDAGVIFGTGFAPFRGGPLNYLKNND